LVIFHTRFAGSEGVKGKHQWVKKSVGAAKSKSLLSFQGEKKEKAQQKK
jgi:hypothetical protein